MKELKRKWKQEVEERAKGVEETHLRVDQGMKIYSEAQLNIGKGGDTAKCPFDCECCF